MSRLVKCLLTTIVAAGFFMPSASHAAEARTVQCSVAINYLVNNVMRAPYQKDFVLTPGVTFEHDFSTFTRFRYFTAASRLENGKTVIAVSYYNDVGVFEAIDLSTELVLHESGVPDTIGGKSSYFTSLGTAGNHTTDYTLTCSRLKD